MPSKVDIANRALRMVGATSITSFTEGTKPANVMSDIYDEILEELLASSLWKFASTRVKLSRSGTAPAFGFDYAYVLPSDWVRTISVSDNDAGVGHTVYREGQVGSQRVLESSSEDLYLNYVKLETDPNLMTAAFRAAFEVSLARECAVPLASSNIMEEQLRIKAKQKLGRAQSVDSLGSIAHRRPQGSWINSRFRSGTTISRF